MKNNISIDDLFRNGLEGGKETLNLGAWANMERLLDGKNPYPIEEDKRKRRIAPLFWILLAIGTVGAGSFLISRSFHNTTEPGIAAVSTVNAGNSASNKNNSTNNSSIESHGEGLATNQPSSHVNAKKQNNLVMALGSMEEGSMNTIQTSRTPSNDVHQTQKSLHGSTPTSGNGQQDVKSQTSRFKKTSLTSIQHPKHSTDASLPAVAMNQPSITDSKSKESGPSRSDINPMELHQAGTPELVLNKTVDMPTVVREQNVSSNKNGTVRINYDTTEQTIVSKTVQVPNPRAVALNSEQEMLAQQHLDLPADKPELISASPMPAASNTAAVDPDVKVKPKKEHGNQGLGGKLQTAAEVIGGGIALAAQKIASKRPIIYPALTAGVNMAMSSQNYGGFQGGLSNATKLNDYFSLLVDLKILYRFNSGYSVRDYQSTFKSIASIDSTTLAAEHKTIYTYQMDSTVRKYNFKSMWAVEVPISLQYHLRKLSFYTGINLSYNPRLNTTTIISPYVTQRTEAVNNNTPFVPSTKTPYQYAQEDFKSRWGMGCMAGASYSFNPRLYVDLRYTQMLWDNSKTNASRAISSGVYKVPYIQLSLGYRFKDFTNDR